VHNAMSGLLRMPSSARPARPPSGFAAFLDRPEVTILVIFEAVFFALERPGWQPELIEVCLQCLKEYAQFKSQNFGTVTSKNKFVQTFLQQLLKLMSLFDPATGQPDSIGGSQHRPLKLSIETLRFVLQIIGAFFQSFSVAHLVETETALLPTARQLQRFVLSCLQQALQTGSKERLNMVHLNLYPVLLRFVQEIRTMIRNPLEGRVDNVMAEVVQLAWETSHVGLDAVLTLANGAPEADWQDPQGGFEEGEFDVMELNIKALANLAKLLAVDEELGQKHLAERADLVLTKYRHALGSGAP
jgi:hypothetical protein